MSACLCTPRSKKPEALKANVGLWYKAGDIELHVGVEKRDGRNKSHLACEVENMKKSDAIEKKTVCRRKTKSGF
jgi:hypothetical protein